MIAFSPLLICVVSLSIIWVCSGILLRHVSRLTEKLKLPSFSFSVLLLGMLTSIPEFAVAINAVWIGTPEVSLGNLIGGQVILLLCVIPILALAKRGLHFRYPLTSRTIAVTLVANAIPFIALLNGMVSPGEALAMLTAFLLFSAIFVTDLEKEHLILEKKQNRRRASTTSHTLTSLSIVLINIIVIFVASHQLVESVSQIALSFGFHPFFVSLILVSLGTNVPEILLAVRSVMSKKSSIALGDYIGSATTNTLIASLVVFASGPVRVNMSTLPLYVPLAGFVLFWIFARSRRNMSGIEATILILSALLFFGLLWQLEVKTPVY